MIPSGLEPKSSEPESDILSIELWDQSGCKNSKTFLLSTKKFKNKTEIIQVNMLINSYGFRCLEIENELFLPQTWKNTMTHTILEEGKKFFEGYTQKLLKTKDFYISENLQLKADHSLRVSKLSAQLARSLDLDNSDCELSELIGLLHDLGRFVQFTEHQSFDDTKCGDHASLGVSLITDQPFFKLLSEYEQQVVIFSIESHNKVSISGKDKQAMLFGQILRDADKLDIWEICISFLKRDGSFSLPSVCYDLPNSPGISENIIKNLSAGKSISKIDLHSSNDFKLMLMGMVFDLNFKLSFQMLNEKQLVKKIYDTLPKRDDVIDLYRKIRLFIENKFIE